MYANAGGKGPILGQLLLIATQAVSQSNLSMHNSTPLVISGNDEIKQLTLLSRLHY
jgi:hypothetical protein